MGQSPFARQDLHGFPLFPLAADLGSVKMPSSISGFLPRIGAVVLVLALLCTVQVRADSQARTGRISVLLIGEFAKPDDSSWPMMRSDPRLVLTLVPAGDLTSPESTERFVRIYMPRRFQDLCDKFDVVYHFDFVPQALTNTQISWIHDAIRDRGMGFAMAEMGWYPVADYWSGNDAQGWMNTALYNAYPADIIIGERVAGRCLEKAVESPLVNLPGIEQAPIVSGGGLHIARAGSTVHARYRGSTAPALITGTYGQGQTFMTPAGWDLLPRYVTFEWPFFLDYIVNPMYLVSGAEIPDDLVVVHRLRNNFMEYDTDRRMVIALMEFLDKWGANVRSVEMMLGDAEGTKKDAERYYLDNQYEDSLKKIETARQMLLDVSEHSGRLKKQAMLWVYLIEWSVVTGTLMICGTLVWFLMIRRRLYKEVGETRGRGR